jgi:putative transposase
MTGELYHVYNRGVDGRNIFSDEDDVRRFFQSMIEFNSVEPIGSLYLKSFLQKAQENSLRRLTSQSEKLVDFVCYCLNPNHFHFVLEQNVEGGISEFMKRLGGYTKYFNEKHERKGSLSQGTYKSRHADDDEYLLHLSVYVNLNARVHKLDDSLSKLTMSSWNEFTDKKVSGICSKEIILDRFTGKAEYRKHAEGTLPIIIEHKEAVKEVEFH